jgi:hypothetical protein
MIKTLKFEEEGLIVDWISFKIQSFHSLYQERLVDYLFKMGFNSYLRSRKRKSSSKEILQADPMNSFEVVFLKDIPYWDGTILEFSGINAREFYKCLKEHTVDWKLFRNPTLSRFDLYYSLETPLTEDSIKSFFQSCQKNSQLNLGYQKNKRGQILRIGRRTSDRFSRIYTRSNRLRFEHEMKGRFLEEYSDIFFRKSWEDFEDILSQHFLQYFQKNLPIESVYLEWLVIKLRSIRPEPVPNLIFKMDYISSIDRIEDQIKVVQFLKFLVYAKDLDYVTQSLGSTSYRCVTFRFRDFLKFYHPTLTNISHYKIQKWKEFFKKLQTDFLLEMFRDRKFQKLISIPKVEFLKERHWIVKVWIVDELFYYNYPFAFPDMFHPTISKTKFAVQFELIRVFSANGLEKRFEIQQFIKNYSSTLSNQSIREIKEIFVELVQILEQNNLIQPIFKILRNGNLESVDTLTSKNISEGFVLYEQLNLLDLEY